MYTTEPVNIGLIGLGYVGLPLAVEFAKKHKVIGYDILQQRVDELKGGKYDGVVLAVAHTQFEELDINSLLKPNSVLYDIKSMLPKSMEAIRL